MKTNTWIVGAIGFALGAFFACKPRQFNQASAAEAANAPVAVSDPKVKKMLEDCKAHVTKRFDDLNICMYGTYESCKKDSSCFVEVRDCVLLQDGKVSCEAEQSLPSSQCVEKILFTKNCDFNISSTIVNDGREDPP